VRIVAANVTADRPGVWLSALVGWAALTHVGIERLRRAVLAATVGGGGPG
jgi:hypothetical protein